MKRFLSLLMVLVLLFTFSTNTYATIAEKLQGHWADSLVSRSFMAYYFPYLARDNFAQFDPEGTITEQNFTISLASLFKDYGYETSGIGLNNILTRENMVDLLGTKLMGIDITVDENIELPFRDINTMSSNNIELLRLLYNKMIVMGDSNASFSPDRELSQVEAILILQRVKEVLERMNTIAFKTLGIVQSYNNQEELIIKEQGPNLLLTITKEFPTPGYSMTVDKIMREGKNYKIYFNIVPPKADTILPQVITYKTLTLEVDKNSLNTVPYNFILDGYNSVIIR
ncbi:protease complex subunit PrcB family protein [Tissierella sp. Yu-01]|uniref:protease complex subunit PrcB family protein n=1 Tax=Tissierella sp. Yu-01 TaxID=3035694 RepID=UPI00240D9DEE|nr:protease complex subunit PrcB family protein [Tissierella sp. Yu-01]WFA08622.1 protease complex subunit PrcB family protein [Tissierella sp. Yu-01]